MESEEVSWRVRLTLFPHSSNQMLWHLWHHRCPLQHCRYPRKCCHNIHCHKDPLAYWLPSYQWTCLFRSPLGIQQLPVTPSPPISHCTPMQVPPLVPPIGPALPQQAPAPSRNAGMSPNAYEVVVTPTRVQKYYGCGNDFSPKYKTLPTNIIIKHVDRRVIRRNKQTGKCTAVISAIHIIIWFHRTFQGKILFSQDLCTLTIPSMLP